ncbi:hypothetical protein RHSIM_Rhsim09G0042600 [Rhododendron simsii]|uniref:Uncharacterized protein n=1 Tax=Rhododendron simsii TaxID=118357 RepID=A0A834GI86_RHOSS|nr:hypothetical protein RHSIM_Rhsim09G0042600 [Rhododendron simsii]
MDTKTSSEIPACHLCILHLFTKKQISEGLPFKYYDLKVEGGAEAVKGSRMPAETSPVAAKRSYYDLKVEGGAEAVKGSRLPAETSPVAAKRSSYPRRDCPS